MFMFIFMFAYFVYELNMTGKVYKVVFWIMTPSSLVCGRQHVGETYCIHLPYVVMVNVSVLFNKALNC
jgi:hypothetical protein